MFLKGIELVTDCPDAALSSDADARAWFEAMLWPDGPICPHCGSRKSTRLGGKSHRPGLLQCSRCREQFTVTVGTMLERTKVPLAKWRAAMLLVLAHPNGISAKQLSASLGLPYKTAWLMKQRLCVATRRARVPGGLTGTVDVQRPAECSNCNGNAGEEG